MNFPCPWLQAAENSLAISSTWPALEFRPPHSPGGGIFPSTKCVPMIWMNENWQFWRFQALVRLGRDVGSAWIRWNPTMHARNRNTKFSYWGNTNFETVRRRSIPRSESSIQLHRSSQVVSSLSLNFSVLRDRTWFVWFNQLVPRIICGTRDTFWNIRHISSLRAILFVTAPWRRLPLGTLTSCSGELSPKCNSKVTPP
jgi:hypothetical protein